MSDIKTTISEQLQQLQMLMHRSYFHSFISEGRMHNPHRGQGRVLSILKLKPEISQKELTYLLGMSKQSLAELLSKLEKSGYITREASKEDKRVMTVRLTEAGMNVSTADNEGEVFEVTKILDCLNDEELAEFSEYLTRIIKRYEEQFPGEDYEERRRHMEQFMARYGHGRKGFSEHGDNPYDCESHFRGRGRLHGLGHESHNRGRFTEYEKSHDVEKDD